MTLEGLNNMKKNHGIEVNNNNKDKEKYDKDD